VTGFIVLIVVFVVVLTIVQNVRKAARVRTSTPSRAERNREQFVKLEAMIEARGENTSIADILRAAQEARSSGQAVTVDLQSQTLAKKLPESLREVLAVAAAAAAANEAPAPPAKRKHKEKRPEPKHHQESPVAPGTRPPLAALGARPPLAAARAWKALEPLQPLQPLAAHAARSNAWR